MEWYQDIYSKPNGNNESENRPSTHYNSAYKSEAISFLSRYLEISREKATQLMNNFPSVIVSTRDYPEDVVSLVYTGLKNNKCTVQYRDIIEENEVCRL